MSTYKIIVLGGSGFLGSHIIQALHRSGISKVTCGDVIEQNSLNCDFVKLDILDDYDIMKTLKGYDTVINCTGQITDPFNLCFHLNSTGVNNLAKAISGEDTRLIQISTVAMYGTAENCNEESPLNPETSYATAKAFAEQILLNNCDHQQLTILRLSNLYGSHQANGIIAYLLRSYHSDRKLNFNNDGTLIRIFMHVEDCADIVAEVVKNRRLNGIFNVKGHETYSVKELLQQFENHFSVIFEKSFNQRLPWENISSLDDSKLRSSINLKPRWKLFDFIEKELESQAFA